MNKNKLVWKVQIVLWILFFYSLTISGQAKYPCDIYIEGYGFLGLSNDINLNDTVKKTHSSVVYFRFVLFDPRGHSYFEIYERDKMIAKGYFANSLDTLKAYASAVRTSKRPPKIEVHKYFHPLKDGEWTEMINGRYVKRNYIMGVLENIE